MTSKVFLMVGAARIELATPAMSTQCLVRKGAENRHSLVPRARTKCRQTVNRAEFHRSHTGDGLPAILAEIARLNQGATA